MLGIAFVTFKEPKYAEAALKEGEMNVEFTTLNIEKALKRAAP